MGGVDVGGGGGGKRSTNTEINMVPFIDLLMVTISFLLLTAVWSSMARLNADAQVPGPPKAEPLDNVPADKMLHIEMRSPEKFTLVWKQGGNVVSTVDVPRKDEVKQNGAIKSIRYDELAKKIKEEWDQYGQHKDGTDKKFDQAVLHTDNETEYVKIIAVIDAVYTPKRAMNAGTKVENVSAFNVTFSVN